MKISGKVVGVFKYIFTKLKILLLFLVLLFAPQAFITTGDRIKYFLTVLYLYTPFIMLYNYFAKWYEDNTAFIEAACIIMFINLVTGGILHFKLKTFSWYKFITKNMFILCVVFSSYFVLEKLFGFFNETFAGDILKNSISFIVLMYPASKFIRSTFILTNGKFPPEYLIRLLYNYEKQGRLKDFFELINGNGVEDIKEQEENSEEARDERSQFFQ